MATVPLPDEPRLEQLRKQAKDLKRAVRAGDPHARAEVTERDPAAAEIDEADVGAFSLNAAQLVVARRYGFASWARLKRFVDFVERYSRFPERDSARASSDSADEFLRLACLTYTDTGPDEWDAALGILAAHPEITDGNIFAAAVAADGAAISRVLATDPGAARREGGPYRWEPLFYLAYARHDANIAPAAVITAARLLLDAGADPNVGYLWHGLPTPFTALTGVFGGGEQGPTRQPRHPHSFALARVLLEAGADPNDAQALYNRMFEPGNDHLELLFEFGLGTGDGGPWRRKLGDALATPRELLRGQLEWAITHGLLARVQLLVEHGVDIASPFADGRSTTETAGTTGHPDVVDYLVAHGAPDPAFAPVDAFVAAALAADRATIDRLEADHPRLRDRVRSERSGLMPWAATTGRPEVVELLVDLGFDVNAKGRTDIPSNEPWQTALHHAAMEGDVDLARTLLRLGADPDVRDQRFDATPLGWARHGARPELVELLEPVTTPDAT